jgi:N-acetylglucosaminyldiphosphoundecaprenol N-acetyl-beta-D-mannosaminyltransferase
MDLAQPASAPFDRSRDLAVARTQATFALYRSDASRLLSERAGLIVTPNLDHLRLLGLSRALRRAYAQADVIVNDSRFLDRLAIRGAVPCIPGSELAPDLLEALRPGSRVCMIGGAPAVQAFLANAFPRLLFAFVSPSMGYIKRRSERRAIVAEVMTGEPDCVFICTGAPQSELMAAQLKRAGCTATLLCCGSAFNFLAGVKPRAPRLFQLLGAEWLWRFVGEGRTRKRYVADALFLLANLRTVLAMRRTGEAQFTAYRLRAR